MTSTAWTNLTEGFESHPNANAAPAIARHSPRNATEYVNVRDGLPQVPGLASIKASETARAEKNPPASPASERRKHEERIRPPEEAISLVRYRGQCLSLDER